MLQRPHGVSGLKASSWLLMGSDETLFMGEWEGSWTSCPTWSTNTPPTFLVAKHCTNSNPKDQQRIVGLGETGSS